MPKARILFGNRVWDASGPTITPSGSATGYAADPYLRNDCRTDIWRSNTNTSAKTLEVIWSAGFNFYAVAVIDPVIHGSGGTLKAEVSSGAGAYGAFGDAGTGLFALPAARTGCPVLYKAGGTTSKDRLLLTYSNPGPVSAYVELGALFVVDSAGYFSATVNVTDDVTIELRDRSVPTVAVGGQTRWQKKRHLVAGRVVFDYVSATQKDALAAIFDSAGAAVPVIIAIDPDNAGLTIYAYLTGGLKLQHRTRDQWSIAVDFEEAA